MNCPSCHTQLPDDAAFCGHCGSALRPEQMCGSCGRANPSNMRFCLGCGTRLREPPRASERSPRSYTPKHLADKILQSKSVLEGERKQVSVLFADVRSSMELAEQLDPEQWHAILDRFFHILADGVHRFEGTVNQYTGDGIMALFGAPIAHEDHAQRACYAALYLRGELARHAVEVKREHGLSLSVRMGIHSGDVVVGKIGDDLRMDYTAQGQTVGLAARMEQLASPDTVYLTEGTASLVSGYFELADLGAFELRGVSEPVRAFQLLGPGELRTRFEVSRRRGLSRFVGRDDDLQALEAALAQCREGNGQVVGIVGEAGVGKSRLCFEFLERCRASGLRVLEGCGVAHGKNVPLLPILQVFRAYFGISEQDDDRTAREKIAGRLLLFDEGFREILAPIFHFFGVVDPERPAGPMEPEARQRQLFGVLRRLVQSGRPESPLVTSIEDLHWIDGGSEAFLEQWVDAIAGTPGLLLVNFRPEYHAEWLGKSYYRQLPLAPLGPEAIRELLDDLLGPDPSIAGLAETIHARTGGNPFFTEEVVQSLIEAGNLEGNRGHYRLVTPVEKLAIPSTVQAMLAARIDRLAEREKQVLQTAAVIGRGFTEPVLERLIELPEGELAAALGALKSSELIYEQALYPVAEYAFKHALTQEVAYGSQLGERRARIHASVAHTIETLFPEKLDEQAALIARHWDRAGKAREAAEWHHRAALWVRLNNPSESLSHWRRVRELLAQVPESPETITLSLAACRSILFDGIRLGIFQEEISGLLAEGQALASRCADRAAVALFFTSIAASMWTLGQLDESCRLAEKARALSDEIGTGTARALPRSVQALAYRAIGHLEEALAAADEAIALVRELTEAAVPSFFAFPSSLPLIAKAWALTQMGRLREAAPVLEQGIERALADHDLSMTFTGHHVGAELARTRGDSEVALAHGWRAVETAEKLGSLAGIALSNMSLAKAQLATGAWDEALAALDAALSVPRDHGTVLWLEPEILSQMAAAHLGLNDGIRARELANQAPALARDRLNKPGECEAELMRARVLLHFDGPSARREIEAALDTASALAKEMNARSFEPFIHVERARLARAANDQASWERELRDAHRLFVEMDATGNAEQLAKELGL